MDTDTLIAQLKDPDTGVRGRAAQKLSNLADLESLPALIDAMGDENSDVRLWAVKAIRSIAKQNEGNPEILKIAIPALAGALNDDYHSVRSWAEVTFGANSRFGLGISTLPWLLSAHTHESPNVRWGSAYALALIPAVCPGAYKHLDEIDSALVKVLANTKLPFMSNGQYQSIRWKLILERVDIPLLAASLNNGFDLRRLVRDVFHNISFRQLTLDEIKKLEAELSQFSASIKKSKLDEDVRSNLDMRAASLSKALSRKKNQLAGRRDLLLEGKPKPPKDGAMYQTARRHRAIARI